jgi:hypothetical protein
MVEKPVVVLPILWTFAPNSPSQQLQNLTVNLAIDGLNRGYEFLVRRKFLGCKKNPINMDLTLLRTLGAYFGSGEFGDFHCRLKTVGTLILKA